MAGSGADELIESTVENDTDSVSLLELTQSNARRILFNDPEQNAHFLGNHVSTAKYNFLTFLPKFLFEQFKRYSNIFFLFIAIIQQVPDVSPTGRYTTIVPLAVILGVSAIKEIFEDWRRHRADDGVNHSLVKALRDTFISIPWQDIHCGDIVKVTNGQFFPADLIILSSSEPMSMCYVETSNLDGETNLKIRQGIPESEHIKDARSALNAVGHVDCEPPNNRLYQFVGNLVLRGRGERPNIVSSLSPDQVLLRGAQLRNTEWVIGVVVYSGHESKVMQNTTAAPIKRSNVDRLTNHQIIFLFTILLVISLFSAVASYIWTDQNEFSHWYLGYDVSGVTAWSRFKTFLTFIILYNNLIPISLTVTLEVVKFCQAYFINWDLEMYDKESDTPARARTSNLNEELGQVEYIFSDKTGTLTRNIMEFRQCTVAGEVYSLPTSKNKNGTFEDAALLENLRSGHAASPFIREFLTILAVCHTVIPEIDPNDPDKIVFQASSPDEAALVMAAKQLGFAFSVRTPETVTISVFGQKEIYEVLDVLEFNSDRKRMSVIVRRKGTEKIKLMCKGADTVILERLSPNQKFERSTMEHLEKFAGDGLRTLCIASADIPPDTYAAWKKEFLAASQALENRDEETSKCYEKIEENLFLIGASAIEDKLQEGVPQAIADFATAGIKLWVLTGDKQETAINIGYACRLLTSKMNLLVFNGGCIDDCRRCIEKFRAQLNIDTLDRNSKAQDAAVIIDGRMLAFALSEQFQEDFLQISLCCKAVVCCRVTPLQKADVVRLVKRKVKAITLAIGDGANDVGMIQAAHVGVGISGQEGLQAASSSDYSIAQFRFLKKLLFVHGAWSFIRLSRVILYSFYKNIVLYIMQLWFAILTGFSGQILFERWTIGLYNVAFTLLPPLAIGIIDQTVSARNRMSHPSLYRLTQSGHHFKIRVFWSWIALSLYHSFLVFVMGLATLGHGNVLSDGKVVGNWYTGTAIYTVALIVVTCRAGLMIDQWSYVTHACIWVGVVLWFAFLLIYGRFWPTLSLGVHLQDVDLQLFSTGFFYFMFILLPIITLTLDICVKIANLAFRKTDEDRVMADEALQAAKSSSPRSFLSPKPRSGGVESAVVYHHLHDDSSATYQRRSAPIPLHDIRSVEGGSGASQGNDQASSVGILSSRQPGDDGYGSVQPSSTLQDRRPSIRRGYAFAQTESVASGHQRSAIPESELIRLYDTGSPSIQ